MERPVAHAGVVFVVAYAVLEDSTSPGQDFYDNLSVGDQAKMNTLFTYLGDHGKISNRHKFKKVKDDLWEFKSHQIRMLCTFSPKRVVIISHGFRKKSDKIPPAEIERAKRILAEDAARDQRCSVRGAHQ